jgi:hypothetical protein
MISTPLGIHVFMALYGLSVFLETSEPQRKGRKRYIAASLIITVLRALGASLDMAHYFQILFKSTSPDSWAELVQLTLYQDWKYLLSTASFGVVILIGDALLVSGTLFSDWESQRIVSQKVYRCYIVCVEYWWVTILPILTSLSALGSLCPLPSTMDAKLILNIVLWYLRIYIADTSSNVAARSSAASAFLTVATNIVVTTFISFRLLRARQNLKRLLPSVDMHVYTGVVAILIESAAPLTIFGIISAILQQLNSSMRYLTPGFFACSYLFDALFYSFCVSLIEVFENHYSLTSFFSKALSPHMIIFRVTTGRSFTKLPTPKDGVLSNSIQFAHQTAESSFLRSTLNREFGRNTDPNAQRELNSRVDQSTQPEMSIVRFASRGDIEKAG